MSHEVLHNEFTVLYDNSDGYFVALLNKEANTTTLYHGCREDVTGDSQKFMFKQFKTLFHIALEYSGQKNIYFEHTVLTIFIINI
jgi:hypothetical protein